MSQNAYERAMNKYVSSPQGQVDMFFMAQDMAARVGPSIMKREAKQTAWGDVDAIERKNALDEARASGDVDAMNKALITMGMAVDAEMVDDRVSREHVIEKLHEAEIRSIDEKLDKLITAITQLVETK